MRPTQASDEYPSPPATVETNVQQWSGRTADLVMHAIALIGTRYQPGGDVPDQGFDCSGLVRYVFQQAWGMTLPRTSQEISHIGTRIDVKDLQSGDLVFYNTLQREFSHVGIYLGDSRFIHSPSSGGQVRIEQMESSYWRSRFDGARRVELRFE